MFGSQRRAASGAARRQSVALGDGAMILFGE
jgi:hypothetical protein